MNKKMYKWVMMALLCIGTCTVAIAKEKKPEPLSWVANFYLEDLSNLQGGVKRGSLCNLQGAVDWSYDTEIAQWWSGGKFTLGWIAHYESANPDRYVGAVQKLSNLDHSSVSRIHNAFYRHTWTDKTSFLLGIMDVNDYFDVSSLAATFLNDSFSLTPTITQNTNASTSPDNGLGAIGIFHIQSAELSLGIFQADPDHLRTVFNRGAMELIEISDSYALIPAYQMKWVQKIGIWNYHPSGHIREPSTKGIYTVSELSWKYCSRESGVFLQWGMNPRKEDIAVSAYLGSGFTVKGLFLRRPKDTFNVGFAQAWVQNKGVELAYEMNYTVQLSEHCVLYPDVQYILKPRGMYPNAWAVLLQFQATFP